MRFRLSANGDRSRGSTSLCDAYSDAIRGVAQDTTLFRNQPHRTVGSQNPDTAGSVIGKYVYLCGMKLRKECNLLEMSVG